MYVLLFLPLAKHDIQYASILAISTRFNTCPSQVLSNPKVLKRQPFLHTDAQQVVLASPESIKSTWLSSYLIKKNNQLASHPRSAKSIYCYHVLITYTYFASSPFMTCCLLSLPPPSNVCISVNLPAISLIFRVRICIYFQPVHLMMTDGQTLRVCSRTRMDKNFQIFPSILDIFQKYIYLQLIL